MLPSASKSQKIAFIVMKCTKTVATRAAPFGPDMHQIVCRLGFAPDPTGGAYSAPPDPLAGLGGGTPGEGEKGGEGKGGEGVGWIATPPPGTGREEIWREGWGWEGREGRGRKGRGGRGNKHTRFKTCGAAHAY